MTGESALQELVDRAAISDVVNAYAAAVDRRDWGLFRSLFTDPLLLDFSSFGPGLNRELSVEELVEISSKVEALDGTQHISSNHRHTIDGDRATCASYMQAGHWITRDGQQHSAFLCGWYDYNLRRIDGEWKITGYGLHVVAEEGDPRVYEWVGLR